MKAAILTISDRCARGEMDDLTGPLISDTLTGAGLAVVDLGLVPDERDRIEAELVRLADQVGADVVFTNGGTGLGPRDVTPEATAAVIDRPVPGIPEAMRVGSLPQTPTAMLSRGLAGIRGRALIVNLPGSPRGARECLDTLLPVLGHAVEMMAGGGHE